MRAIWSGAIGFGLVNIPVKIFSATHDSKLDLDMLDKRDHAPIKFQRVNVETGQVVDWENIVKGYKYDDEYVILEDDDFEKANAKKSKTIEIFEFIKEEEIDSIYFETPYYLQPDKSGVRAYALLREALKDSKKIGISSFVMRTKEALAIIKPMDDVLVLNKIRFQQEIRPADELNLPVASNKTIKEGEMKMALLLIDQLTKPFDISAYKDTYTEELLKVIEAKTKGKQTPVIPLKEAPVARDLMAQLKASLESRKAS